MMKEYERSVGGDSGCDYHGDGTDRAAAAATATIRRRTTTDDE